MSPAEFGVDFPQFKTTGPNTKEWLQATWGTDGVMGDEARQMTGAAAAEILGFRHGTSGRNGRSDWTSVDSAPSTQDVVLRLWYAGQPADQSRSEHSGDCGIIQGEDELPCLY